MKTSFSPRVADCFTMWASRKETVLLRGFTLIALPFIVKASRQCCSSLFNVKEIYCQPIPRIQPPAVVDVFDVMDRQGSERGGVDADLFADKCSLLSAKT